MADHGWLKSNHTFSFANYHNRGRMNFGVLRVINDDFIAAGMGFGRHPHSDMEIITIPLEGDLRHGDSMGNNGVITKGEIQVMSAGTGIEHSEMNANKDKPVTLLQIWVIPNKTGVTPRYDQKRIDENIVINDFQQIVSPNENEVGVWIHQNAWFNMANFTKGNAKEYSLHLEGNGVYVFVISGKAYLCGGVSLAAGVADVNELLEFSPETGTGVAELKNDEISLFPNPCKGEIYINTSKKGIIDLYDISGKHVLRTHVSGGSNKISLDNFPAGIYSVAFNGIFSNKRLVAK